MFIQNLYRHVVCELYLSIDLQSCLYDDWKFTHTHTGIYWSKIRNTFCSLSFITQEVDFVCTQDESDKLNSLYVGLAYVTLKFCCFDAEKDINILFEALGRVSYTFEVMFCVRGRALRLLLVNKSHVKHILTHLLLTVSMQIRTHTFSVIYFNHEKTMIILIIIFTASRTKKNPNLCRWLIIQHFIMFTELEHPIKHVELF